MISYSLVLCLGALISADGDDAPSVRNGQAVPVRLRFVPGRRLVYRIENQRSFEQQGETWTSATRSTLSFQTRKVEGDRADIVCRFDRVIWSPPHKGEELLVFDSSKPAKGPEPPPFVALRKLVGQSFAVTLDTRGQILAMQDLTPAGQDPAANDPNVQGVVGEGQLRRMLRTMYAWVPEQPVGFHRPWSRSEEQELGIMTMTRTNTLQMTPTLRGRWKIASRIDLSAQPGQGVANAKQKVVGELVSSDPGAAEIVFNPDTGRVESLQAHIGFQMKVVTTEASKPEPTSVTQRVRASTVIELLPSESARAN
ncbi:hypothetical protein Pan216_50150 [Planctomycetes bacterium Pan216]|uniref:Uncharacterized protein n=1 Tax=Kolteria novifilia TaxID=2527975 RepID=A0A518BAW6_9BACT|nr:hypothetical protein Pan216_50150 [Planctomycetes bacterium Pan216]